MGTPEFAVPTLEALIDTHQVVGVVTQPDRPRGRRRRLTPSPVKQVALEHDLPLSQPQSLRLPAAVAQLAAWEPDVIVVAAFGQILRQDVLDLPPCGSLNVHAPTFATVSRSTSAATTTESYGTCRAATRLPTSWAGCPTSRANCWMVSARRACGIRSGTTTTS